ncbi:MAG: lactonase family protein, partial [Clostridium sp.]
MSTYIGYIGTYTKGKSEGIYSFLMNSSSGLISEIKLAAKLENPTYLTINNETKKLYSIVKADDENNILCGGVSSFNINNDSTLSYISSSINPGKPPCYIILDTITNNLFSANYHQKNIISYNLKESGEINNINSEIFHEGDSHIHYVSITPDRKYLCALDLGLDKVFLYQYNNGNLTTPKILKVKDGCGPRHIAFHPNGKYAYVICESSSEIITLSYNIEDGFSIINYISTIPESFTDVNSTAAILISSDGKFLYGSNRGHNSIVVYSISLETGDLTLVDNYNTYGVGPRDFNFTPDEKFIVISNELTSNLTVYKRNTDLGLDKVFLYQYNNGNLTTPKILKVKDGCGPRHIAFHPN